MEEFNLVTVKFTKTSVKLSWKVLIRKMSHKHLNICSFDPWLFSSSHILKSESFILSSVLVGWMGGTSVVVKVQQRITEQTIYDEYNETPFVQVQKVNSFSTALILKLALSFAYAVELVKDLIRSGTSGRDWWRTTVCLPLGWRHCTTKLSWIFLLIHASFSIFPGQQILLF